jgi:hypothetical protein
VGDFNGDAVPDLAVVSDYPRGVSILLGNGDGSFQAARDVTVEDIPYSVAVGDFNGDGVPDLALAVHDTTDIGRLSVFLGNGDGSFRTTGSFAVGSFPIFVAVGDFNADGALDVAVANSNNHSVSVLLGNGDGSFQAARNFAALYAPQSVAVGDLDGDGVLDLAVATGSSVSVLLGTGDGSFQTALKFAPPGGANSVAVGDFNADGLLDVAATGSSLSILINNTR